MPRRCSSKGDGGGDTFTDLDSLDGEKGRRTAMEEEGEEERDVRGGTDFMQRFAEARDAPFIWMSEHPTAVKLVLSAVLLVLYNVYLVMCVLRYVHYELEWEWCDELGFLLILTAIVYAGLIYYQVYVLLGTQEGKKSKLIWLTLSV